MHIAVVKQPSNSTRAMKEPTDLSRRSEISFVSFQVTISFNQCIVSVCVAIKSIKIAASNILMDIVSSYF